MIHSYLTSFWFTSIWNFLAETCYHSSLYDPCLWASMSKNVVLPAWLGTSSIVWVSLLLPQRSAQFASKTGNQAIYIVILSLATVGKSPFNYFSAVCWLFGKLLYKELGYPIGLIDTTWGGTPAEAWSSPDALANCGLENTVPQEKFVFVFIFVRPCAVESHCWHTKMFDFWYS